MIVQVIYLDIDIDDDNKLTYKEIYRVGQRYIKKQDIKESDKIIGIMSDDQLKERLVTETLPKYKIQKILNIKRMARRLIEKDYPIWKQNNLQGEAIKILCMEKEQLKINPNYQLPDADKEVLTNLGNIKEGVDKIRKISDELEESLENMDLVELKAFNAYNNTLWQ